MPGFRRRRPTACYTHLATQQAVGQLPHTCPRALCWSSHLNFCRWLLHVHAAKPLNKVLYSEIRNQQKNFGSSRCQRIGNIDISTNTIDIWNHKTCYVSATYPILKNPSWSTSMLTGAVGTVAASDLVSRACLQVLFVDDSKDPKDPQWRKFTIRPRVQITSTSYLLQWNEHFSKKISWYLVTALLG